MEETKQTFYNFSALQKFAKNKCIIQHCNVKYTDYSYAQVIDESLKFQQLLLQHEVGAEIALNFSEQTPALLCSMLGLLNNNGYFCPLADHGSWSERIAAQVQRFGAHWLISDVRFEEDDENYQLHFQCQLFGESLYMYKIDKNLVNESMKLPGAPMCYAIGTSGSTGAPKTVFVPYKCIEPNVVELSTKLHIKSTDVIMLNAPMTFDPFVIEFFLMLYNGAALLLTTKAIRLSPTKLLNTMFPAGVTREQRGVTILQMTPSLFRLLAAAEINKNIIFNTANTLRILILGGEEFPTQAELCAWLPTATNKEIYNIYGITEVSCWSTLQKWSPTVARISLGLPIDGTTKLRLIDATGNVVHGAGKGQLQIGSAIRKCWLRGDNVDASEVDRNEELYRCTGDLVERDAAENLYYVGRLQNTTKRYGKLLHLDQLATKIKTILTQMQARGVICLKSEETQQLISIINLTARDARKEHKCRQLMLLHLANHEKPDKIEFLEKMPLTAHGKIDRRQCLQQRRHQKETNMQINKLKPVEKFKEFLEKTLALEITEPIENLSETLNEKRLKTNLQQSFTAAGGTSFHALSLATEISTDLLKAEEQKQFLDMLLNEQVLLVDIIEFLNMSSVVEVVNIVDKPKFVPAKRRLHHIELLWQSDMLKCVDAAPALYCVGEEKFICVGSHAHVLRTFNAASGELLATLTLPDRIEGQVVFLDQQLAFVGCYDGHLYAFNYVSGEIAWRFHVGGMIKSKPVVVAEQVIVASYANDFNLSSICLKHHRLKWQQRIGTKGLLATPLLLQDNNLIVCSLDGSYGLVNAANGHIQWLQNLATPIFANAATAFKERCLILAEVSGKVHICKLSSGEILAQFNAAGNIFSGINIRHINANEILIIFGCHDHNLYCLKYCENQPTIQLHWRRNLESPIYAKPFLFPDSSDNYLICACTTKGLVVILDLNNGLEATRHELNGEVFSTPFVDSDEAKIYVGCRNNYLYCLAYN